MNLAQLLSWTAERRPSRRAVGGAYPLTYRQWDAWTNQIARALTTLGVKAGDRVIALMAGGEPLASLHLAVQKLGATTVPLSTRYSVDEVAYCIGDAEAVLVVGDETTATVIDDALARLEKAPVRAGMSQSAQLLQGGVISKYGGRSASAGAVDLSAIALEQSDGSIGVDVQDDTVSVMLYTSGTTGKPKGVPRTHRNEMAASIAHVIQANYADGEVSLGAMPLFHTMGMRSLLSTIIVSGTWVPQARFQAEEALELIARERISALYLVPTAYWSLLHTDRLGEATTVRKIAYAGAAMTPALSEQLSAVLNPEVFVNHFGSTEVYTFTINPDARAKPACAGRAGVFTRVRVVSPENSAGPDDLVAQGEQGQVIVSLSCDEAFSGYWRRPDADAKALRGGWYFTGDLANTDQDGDLWVVGRVDDMINSGGENIYPNEIEDALARCPDVADVVVAGLPDEKWGQIVTAFIVPNHPGNTRDTVARIEDFVRNSSGLSSLKRPKKIILVESIPKSAVGKILRRELTAGNYKVLGD